VAEDPGPDRSSEPELCRDAAHQFNRDGFCTECGCECDHDWTGWTGSTWHGHNERSCRICGLSEME
jgi:hypothetical protein